MGRGNQIYRFNCFFYFLVVGFLQEVSEGSFCISFAHQHTNLWAHWTRQYMFVFAQAHRNKRLCCSKNSIEWVGVSSLHCHTFRKCFKIVCAQTGQNSKYFFWALGQKCPRLVFKCTHWFQSPCRPTLMSELKLLIFGWPAFSRWKFAQRNSSSSGDSFIRSSSVSPSLSNAARAAKGVLMNG